MHFASFAFAFALLACIFVLRFADARHVPFWSVFRVSFSPISLISAVDLLLIIPLLSLFLNLMKHYQSSNVCVVAWLAMPSLCLLCYYLIISVQAWRARRDLWPISGALTFGFHDIQSNVVCVVKHVCLTFTMPFAQTLQTFSSMSLYVWCVTCLVMRHVSTGLVTFQ